MMPETVLEWLSAGEAPLTVVLVVIVYRLERRVLRLEFWLRGDRDRGDHSSGAL